MIRVASIFTFLTLTVTLLVGVEVAWGFWAFPVEVVKIEGNLSPEERKEVRAVVLGTLQSSGNEVRGVVAAINRLGWSRNIRVRRVWPRTIHVSLARETLAARWGDHSFLTTDGEIVRAPLAPEVFLPKLSGTLSSGSGAMQIYAMLSKQLSRHGLKATELIETKLGEWRLMLSNGTTVLLGSTDLNARMERALAVYRSVLVDRIDRVDRIDARYGSGVAVRWRNHSQRGTSLTDSYGKDLGS